MLKKKYETKFTFGNEGSSDAFFIRTNVFMIEQGFRLEFDDQDKISWHLTVYDGEEPIAAARCYKNDDDSWQIGRLCVLEDYRSAGVGAMALGEVEAKILSLGGREARLSSQVQAISFYRKNGYLNEGSEYLDESCPHIAMKKALA